MLQGERNMKDDIAYEWYLKHTDPIKYVRRIGVSISDACRLNGSPNWGSEPWISGLENHTEISFEYSFIAHDGATWIFREREKYKKVLRFGKIKIGNNCAVGANSTICLVFI